MIKKVLLFLSIFIFIAFGIIALLLVDFSFGNNLGPSDGEIILQYIITDGTGDVVDRRSEVVPAWFNEQGELETKRNQSKFLDSAEFDVPGHNFNGWYIDGKKYNGGDWVPAGLTQMIIEIRSDWRPRTLTVTYDGRLGTTPGRMSVFYGMDYGEAANAISVRPSHKLVGWYTLPDKQGELITSDTKVTDTDNIKLYAAWEATNGGAISDVFTINFDLNSTAALGTVSIPGIPTAAQYVDPAVQNINANLPAAVSTDTKDNFAGWFESGRLNGTQIRTYREAQDLQRSGSTNVYLVAKWNNSGGTGTTESLRIDFDLAGIGQNNGQGMSITVEGNNVWFNTPTSNDSRYTFVRWTYNGKTVTNSNDVRKEGAVAYAIVVAEWKFTPSVTSSFTVTFDLNTGTNNPNGSTVTVTTQNYTFVDATKTGSTFMGWFWSGRRYSDAFALRDATGGTGATVVAQWDTVVAPGTWTVTLRNNKDNRTSTISAAQGTTFINLPWSFVDATFDSWRIGSTVVSTNATFLYDVTGNVELMAYFNTTAPTTWTVTLKNNINSSVATIPNARGNTTIESPSSYFGSLGTFQYWTINGIVISSSNQPWLYHVSDNVTLTAHFQQAIYTVTLNNNINNSTYTIPNAGGNMTINNPSSYFGTLSGTFQYWAVNGIVVGYTQSFTYNVTGNVTITAYFLQQSYTITLKNNVNTSTTTINNVNGNTTINSPSSYFGTLSGTFQYWALESAVMSYNQSFIFYVTGNATLTAHYQQPAPTTYTITLKNNLTNSVTYIYNAKNSTIINSPSSYFGTLNGTFDYWAAGSTVVSYSQSFSYYVTANVTLTAYYKQATYKVTLRNNVNSDSYYLTNSRGSTYISSPLSYFGTNTFNRYEFHSWRQGSTVVSYSQYFYYNVTSDVTLTAYYKEVPLTINFCSQIAFKTSHPSIVVGTTNVVFTTNVKAQNSNYTFVRWRLGNPYSGPIVTSTNTTKTAAQNLGMWGNVEVFAEWRYS